MTNELEIKINGRNISEEELEQIKEITKVCKRLSLEELVKTVGVNLKRTFLVNSKGENDIEEVLCRLEELGYIKLPEKSTKKHKNCGNRNGFLKKKEILMTDKTVPLTEISGVINDFLPVEVELVDSVDKECLWDEYVERYHELKYGSPFGDRLKYFVKIGGEASQYAGCIIFSASSWALENRDKWIGWTKEDRALRLNLIINNTRFLIFPWIKVRNLASWSLAEVSKRVGDDWSRNFKYTPVLLETFVDVGKYHGTCYKAANWAYLGNTKGRGRQDRHTQKLSSPKAIYMYPLTEDFRDYLTGKKSGGEIK
jgi:hypothetical protein